MIANEDLKDENRILKPPTGPPEDLQNEIALSEEIHYVTDNEQTVTFVCSESALPLLASDGQGLVSFVELSNVEGVEGALELDGDLEYQGNIVLENTFHHENQIAVMNDEGTEAELHLLRASEIEDEQEETVTYFQTRHARGSNILSRELIKIPSSEVVTRGTTITLPLSFVSNSEVSLLRSFSHLPINIEESNHNDTPDDDIPVSIESNYAVDNEPSGNFRYILPHLSQSVVSKQELGLVQRFINSDQDSSKLKPRTLKALKKKLPRPHKLPVGRPPKFHRRKVIGSGPMAISAHGVVQEIGNRLVTVLPRPEDLRKLKANKLLLLPIRGSSVKNKGNAKIITKPSNPSSLLSKKYDENYFENETATDDRLADEDFTPRTLYDSCRRKRKRGRGRWKRGRRGTIVISSSGKRPGRPRKVTTLVEGLHGPKIIHTGPDIESQDVGEGSNETVNHREKDDSTPASETLNVEVKDKLAEENSEIPELSSKRKLPPRNRGAKYKKVIELLKKEEYEDDDIDASDEDEEDSSNKKRELQEIIASPKGKRGENKKRELQEIIASPKGKRGRPKKSELSFSNSLDRGGTKIIKLNENLKPIESMSSPSVLIRDGDGASSTLQSKLIITFEQPCPGGGGELAIPQISVEALENRVDDGIESQIMMDLERNITLVPNNQDVSDDETTTICVRENDGACVEEKSQSGLHWRLRLCGECRKPFASRAELKEHGRAHRAAASQSCDTCNQEFKSVALVKGYEAEDDPNCGKTDISHYHSHFDSLEFLELKCYSCGQSFNTREALEQHSDCPVGAKYFICDICHLKFFSSSGLNRHRKVHDRSNNNGLQQEGLKCSICYASFSFESSLEKHRQMVHEGVLLSDDKSAADGSIDTVIEQLKDKLNEGYAPKNSELYDLPKEEETLEMPSKDPFLCGICDDPFKDIDQLCDHYTSCHTGEQILYCIICSVGCSFLYQLEKHKQIHLQEEQKQKSLSVPSLANGSQSDPEKHPKCQAKLYKCNFCQSSFSIKSALDKHILVHTGQRPYLCDICLKSFRQSAALVRHKLWTHKLKNQNKCKLCTKTFFTANLLICHLDTHGDEAKELKEQLLMKKELRLEASEEESRPSVGQLKSKVCEYCGKEFATIVALLTHKITHKLSASYKCDQCHRTFRERRYLKKHKLTHKGLKMWKCEICSKTFATKLTLIRHSHVHIREAFQPDSVDDDGSTLPSVLKCDECNLNFSHKTHYVRHKLLHFGIPLLKCGLCDKLFVHKSDVIRHKVMHSFMFSCNICGRNFHKRSLYAMHKKRHIDPKPFKCERCGKAFATSGNFRIHNRIHSGEKPYRCNVCNYRCSQSGRLLKHKRIHTGEKLSSCDICGKGFVNAESAKSHQRIHTGERPFKCVTCDKGFINSASLSQHLRDHWKEQLYKCEDCPHKFRRSDHLVKHRLFHQMRNDFEENKALGLNNEADSENPLYMCEICGRVFDRKKYLYTHHNVHSRQKMYGCTICNKHLASRLALKNHLMIHSGEMPHKCTLCDKEFRNLSNLKRHEKVHSTQEMLNCKECGETFYSSQLLKEHKRGHMNLMMINSQTAADVNQVSQRVYVFDDAQQLLVNESQQRFLVGNSESILVFPESANANFEVTSRPENSDQEEAADSAEEAIEEVEDELRSPIEAELEPVEDDLPSDPDTERRNLEEVTEQYDDEDERRIEKPHECDVCLKTFAKKQYLTKHKYRHREVKPHSCDICGKGFAQKFEVAVHKFRHTGEKPYQCDICLKDFRSKVNLANHKMRHTGEYPFLCSVCNKGLSTQPQLERHVSLHTGAHPFKCQICDKGYFQKGSFLRHLTKHHNSHSVSSFEEIQPLDNSEAAEQMEVMEAISTIRAKNVKVETDIDIEIGDLAGEFVESQPEYLRSSFLDSQHIGSKFLNSIFHKVEEDGDDNG